MNRWQIGFCALFLLGLIQIGTNNFGIGQEQRVAASNSWFAYETRTPLAP